MIISRWRGFEIDSSEGYYSFTSDTDDVRENWRYLKKILKSPLIWNKAAFSLGGIDEKATEEIYGYLADMAAKGEIESTKEMYKYCPYRYAGTLNTLQIILDRFQKKVEFVRINFCIRPLNSIEGDEYSRLKTWFLSQFSDQKEGKNRWIEYETVGAKDLTLGGNADYTDSFTFHYAFEASLQFYPTDEKRLSLFLCAGDPSFFIYLISTVFSGYDLEYYGDHWITIDRRPDKLRDLLD